MRLLEYVPPGTIIYITDQNPMHRSTSQPERVSAFIENIFEATNWDKIAFAEFDRNYKKLRNQHGPGLPIHNELASSDCFITTVQAAHLSYAKDLLILKLEGRQAEGFALVSGQI